jgi:hypothetical protein
LTSKGMSDRLLLFEVGPGAEISKHSPLTLNGFEQASFLVDAGKLESGL